MIQVSISQISNTGVQTLNSADLNICSPSVVFLHSVNMIYYSRWVAQWNTT